MGKMERRMRPGVRGMISARIAGGNYPWKACLLALDPGGWVKWLNGDAHDSGGCCGARKNDKENEDEDGNENEGGCKVRI